MNTAERLQSYSKEQSSSFKLLGEKGSTRWRLTKAGIWATGGLIAAVALIGSFKIGALIGILSGAVGYKRAAVKV